jgi:hypothetical protein
MAKRTKLNTMDLIRQMTEQKEASLNVLEDLKDERNVSPTPDKQHFRAKNVTKEMEKSSVEKAPISQPRNTLKKSGSNSAKLDRLLSAKKQNFKKDAFMFTLNGDILTKYEKLAVGMSYKLDSKISRNQLMRKVLADFMYKNYQELIKEIDLK